MINYVVLKKIDKQSYIVERNSGDFLLYIIRLFLISDIGPNGSFYKQWALNPLHNETGGNISWIIKKGNEIILRLDPAVLDESHYFTTTQEQFIQIIETWEKLMKQKPNHITIYRDHNYITFSGEN